ncbi:MAG: GNAT family N-acetyltransferase, partial [Lawsonibacter sp.]|nr:GNAT family N-acetyltransferase [Lawsonibacter sp.]
MDCMIRKWRISDRERLAEMLNNPKVLDNLRDGLPYPYTPADGEEYIRSMLAA